MKKPIRWIIAGSLVGITTVNMYTGCILNYPDDTISPNHFFEIFKRAEQESGSTLLNYHGYTNQDIEKNNSSPYIFTYWWLGDPATITLVFSELGLNSQVTNDTTPVCDNVFLRDVENDENDYYNITGIFNNTIHSRYRLWLWRGRGNYL